MGRPCASWWWKNHVLWPSLRDSFTPCWSLVIEPGSRVWLREGVLACRSVWITPALSTSLSSSVHTHLATSGLLEGDTEAPDTLLCCSGFRGPFCPQPPSCPIPLSWPYWSSPGANPGHTGLPVCKSLQASWSLSLSHALTRPSLSPGRKCVAPTALAEPHHLFSFSNCLWGLFHTIVCSISLCDFYVWGLRPVFWESYPFLVPDTQDSIFWLQGLVCSWKSPDLTVENLLFSSICGLPHPRQCLEKAITTL